MIIKVAFKEHNFFSTIKFPFVSENASNVFQNIVHYIRDKYVL